MRFKGLSGKGVEKQIGLALMYYFVNQDSSILLTTDRKTIVNQSWEDIKKLFSNGGKIIYSLKKVKDYVENNLISNAHFA